MLIFRFARVAKAAVLCTIVAPLCCERVRLVNVVAISSFTVYGYLHATCHPRKMFYACYFYACCEARRMMANERKTLLMHGVVVHIYLPIMFKIDCHIPSVPRLGIHHF